MNMLVTSMMFFPDKVFYEKPADYGLVSEDVTVRTADGISLHGWWLKGPPEKGVLLYFHGNAGNISGRIFKAEGWVKRGYSVFLIDYRGYGKSGGKIEHGEDIVKDARAAWRWLVEEMRIPPSKIILYGESLGSHPAIRLAAEEKPAALILEAPYTSFEDLAALHYPFVPKGLVRDFRFPNTEYINRIKAPLFILHGTRDDICPYEGSERLFEKAPEPKSFLTIENGAHNDLPVKAGEDYWNGPVSWLERAGVGR